MEIHITVYARTCAGVRTHGALLYRAQARTHVAARTHSSTGALQSSWLTYHWNSTEHLEHTSFSTHAWKLCRASTHARVWEHALRKCNVCAEVPAIAGALACEREAMCDRFGLQQHHHPCRLLSSVGIAPRRVSVPSSGSKAPRSKHRRSALPPGSVPGAVLTLLFSLQV